MVLSGGAEAHLRLALVIPPFHHLTIPPRIDEKR